MVATRVRLFGCLVCVAAAAWGASLRAEVNDAAEAAAELNARYVADLEKLAKWCEANGLTKEAQKTRRVLSPSDPYKLYVPVLPDQIGPPKLPDDAPAKVVEWDGKLRKLRCEYATTRYEMARRAVRSGQAGLAFVLTLDAIQANPDLEPARRLLGYQKYRDQWRTLYEAKKLRAGFVWNEKFGWLPKAYERRYEAGERYCDGRWISADEDAERHSDIQSGWQIETEHYVIRTNSSIEAAVALGVKLERLNRLWQRLFIRYYASEADVVALFEGRLKRAMASPLRHNVVYFRDRDDYNRSLRTAMPGIEISVGVYRDIPGCAYFFAGKDSDERTMYHEATHQLFHESRLVIPDVGRQCNFWIVEGIAMYMESLRREDGYDVLGGFDDERLHAARYRLLHDHFYVPFAEFVDFGREKLQKDPRIATLYSQAAGLTHFLIYYDEGLYRDALVSYLSAVYTGRDRHGTLAKLTGATYGDLDKQYREFLEGKQVRETTADEASPANPPANNATKK
jgi:Protein of unknown function (DUF1570)